ncbi:uncharacterized protein LOC143427040 [Xylocopa sonorina]|uniref:uncharacterized protein LOC143427040 n=1 Tax=Xylocopa sonorina TaxID=1818115 RepID=UPI00403ADA39
MYVNFLICLLHDCTVTQNFGFNISINRQCLQYTNTDTTIIWEHANCQCKRSSKKKKQTHISEIFQFLEDTFMTLHCLTPVFSMTEFPLKCIVALNSINRTRRIHLQRNNYH